MQFPSKVWYVIAVRLFVSPELSMLKMLNLKISILILLICLFGNRPALCQAPVINDFTPTSGLVGSSVLITGSNYSPTLTNNIVYFGAVKAEVIEATSTQLKVSVPTGATYKKISVTVNGLMGYSSMPFNVTFPSSGTINSSSFSTKVDYPVGLSLDYISMGDIDGDGKSDIVAIDVVHHNFTEEYIHVLRNVSTSGVITKDSFASKVTFAKSFGRSLSLAMDDLNGDGKLDLVLSNFDANSISIFPNTSTPGEISFAPRIDIVNVYRPYGVAIGDLDEDGRPDIVVSTTINSVDVINVYKNIHTSGSITVNSFAPKVIFNAASNSFNLTINDIDGDRKPEIILSSGSAGSFSVFRNKCTPGIIDSNSFDGKVDFFVGYNPQNIAVGDLDNDNKPDIVVSQEYGSSKKISVYKNTSTLGSIGANSFAPQVNFTTGSSLFGLAISDVDGDSKPDIAVTACGSSTCFVSIYRNISTSGILDANSFKPRVDFVTKRFAYSLAIGDINGDGKPELITESNNEGFISILTNTNKPSPPVVQGLVPSNGTIGTGVTITGSGFSNNPEHNIISFNGTPAVAISSTTTSITVKVPDGASSGLVSVTTYDQTSTSSSNFTVDLKQQTITFEVLPAVLYGEMGPSLSAWASSGLAINYSSSNDAV